jgi:spore maturation protein CgeB
MSGRSRIVFLGLTITSSWGNGHATTYRGLIRELARRKHDVLFLEREAPWYSENRDLPKPPYA